MTALFLLGRVSVYSSTNRYNANSNQSFLFQLIVSGVEAFSSNLFWFCFLCAGCYTLFFKSQ